MISNYVDLHFQIACVRMLLCETMLKRNITGLVKENMFVYYFCNQYHLHLHLTQADVQFLITVLATIIFVMV